MANSHTRYKRREAHRALDKVCSGTGALPRSLAYKFLATHMGMSQAECHIGRFDSAQCEQVIKFFLDLKIDLNNRRKR